MCPLQEGIPSESRRYQVHKSKSISVFSPNTRYILTCQTRATKNKLGVNWYWCPLANSHQVHSLLILFVWISLERWQNRWQGCEVVRYQVYDDDVLERDKNHSQDISNSQSQDNCAQNLKGRMSWERWQINCYFVFLLHSCYVSVASFIGENAP